MLIVLEHLSPASVSSDAVRVTQRECHSESDTAPTGAQEEGAGHFRMFYFLKQHLEESRL